MLLAEGMIIMTVRRRKSPEQIVRSLGQADLLLANGVDVAAVCRELGVSESTYYRWRERYGGMDVDEVKAMTTLTAPRCSLVSGSRPARPARTQRPISD